MKEFTERVSGIIAELKAPKSQYNKFGKYNYRNCEDILEGVKPLLKGLVLTLSDEIILVGERYYVKATAEITDGKNVISNSALAREPIAQAGMAEPQVTGSASSYARKYALNGLFCIDDTKDADSQDNRGQGKANPATNKPDYTARNNKIQEIKGMAGKITENQNAEQKMSFMKEFLKISEFKEMFRKNDKQLDEIYENLKDMM